MEAINGVTDDESCPGSIFADAKLGGLANNTGPTNTHALPTGSPAIDTGGSCPPTDQRGVSRPQGAGCDVGAFEGAVSSPPSGSGGGGGAGGGGTSQPPSADDQDELPAPEAGEEVNAVPKSGTVKVKCRGPTGSSMLEEGRQIPVGTVVDTLKGRVTMWRRAAQSATSRRHSAAQVGRARSR